MTERRYTEEEVAAIFQRAAEPQASDRRLMPTSEGMTLAELQDIGRQVGIAPDVVARAALSLDRDDPAPVRRFLGLPVGVGRTVELGRTLSDEEWERLVVDLRRTFDAKGVVSRDGTLRQWTNGNLHAYLEPGESGQRLRMRTFNESARLFMLGGLGYAGVGVVIALSAWLTGRLAGPRLTGVAVLTLIGGGLFAIGAARLPAWARRRLEQMQGLADRLLGTPPPGPDRPAG